MPSEPGGEPCRNPRTASEGANVPVFEKANALIGSMRSAPGPDRQPGTEDDVMSQTASGNLGASAERP